MSFSTDKKTNFDIIVAGGGLSGVSAAVAAAREGAQVLLIEQYGFLGGMATAGLVNPFMAYATWKDKVHRNWNDKANRGIFEEILLSLSEMGGLHKNRMTFHEEFLKIILDRMIKKSGITVLFHSFLSGVHRVGNKILSVTVTNKSGTTEYAAKYFIDATGDADLSAMAKCEYSLGRPEDGLCQPMTLCFRVGNIDPEKYAPVYEREDSIENDFGVDRSVCQKKVNEKYLEMKNKHGFRNIRDTVLTFDHVAQNVVHFNSTRIAKKLPIHADEFSEAEMEAREQAYELYCFMKEHVEGFENSHLLMTATQVGVRESRRVIGHYTVTAEDLLQAIKFEDSIARGTYPIDMHAPAGKEVPMRFIPENDYYTIPYRALIPKGLENLLVAGRPISTTHEAHGACRVMPICTCVGEGAGTAAVIAWKQNIDCTDVKIEELHSLLDQYGALY